MKAKIEKTPVIKWREELAMSATVEVAGVVYPYHPTRFEVVTYEKPKPR